MLIKFLYSEPPCANKRAASTEHAQWRAAAPFAACLNTEPGRLSKRV